MKEPSAQIQHATTDFCIAPRLAESGAHSMEDLITLNFSMKVKRYPEPMAHGPEACEPSHPLWPMAQKPASRHTRAEAVDTGYPCSLTREIWNPISNQ